MEHYDSLIKEIRATFDINDLLSLLQVTRGAMSDEHHKLQLDEKNSDYAYTISEAVKKIDEGIKILKGEKK